jgi:two-component system alkaline phosphatase synthesis response regulator PhoP
MAADKIMVVDDDRNIRLALKYRLEKEGCNVLLASDGADALEKVRAEKPDLILLDLTMPRMDGFGFLEEIRGNGRTSAVPVIVLTAYGYESNRAKSLELGAAEFVTKPFSPRQLVSEVWKVLREKKKKVLVIDDDISVRDLLAGLLEAEGCVVDTAEDGPSGVEKALAGDYDLIFMDSRIPGCGADEATERIIAEKLGQRIVITTAGPGHESVHRALESGALACVSKPFGIEDVRRIKREWLEESS